MLEREKWNLVAEAMKLAGISKYPGAFLEKEYRKATTGEDDNVELSNKGSTVSSPGHIPNVMRSQDQVPGPPASPTSYTHSNETEGPRATHSESSANNHQGFGILFDRGPFQYGPQQVPENVRARMTEYDSSFQNQASYPTRSTRPGAPPMQPPLNAMDEPYPQPITKRPLPSKKSGQNPNQHEAPPTEAFSSIKGASIPSIQYTSTGAPIFVDNPALSTTAPERIANAFSYTSEASPAEVLNATEAAVAVVNNSASSTPAWERTTCVSPSTFAESPAEVTTATEAAVTEAPTPAAAQPKTGTAFMSVDDFRDERQRDQSSERQQGPAVTKAPALVATPPNTENTFVAVNGPQNTTQDDQRLATDAPASVATSSNTETAFVSVNEPRNDQQDDQGMATNTTGALATRSKTGTAFVSVNESSGEKQSGQSLETAKWEWQGTRSRPRLANDSYFVLEREYQQDPKPTTEYKEGLAKTLDTTYFKINVSHYSSIPASARVDVCHRIGTVTADLKQTLKRNNYVPYRTRDAIHPPWTHSQSNPVGALAHLLQKLRLRPNRFNTWIVGLKPQPTLYRK